MPRPSTRASTLARLGPAGDRARAREIVRRIDVHEHDLGRGESRHLLLGNHEYAHVLEEADDLEPPRADPRLHRVETALAVARVERLELPPGPRGHDVGLLAPP